MVASSARWAVTRRDVVVAVLSSVAALAGPAAVAASLTASACVTADPTQNVFTCEYKGPVSSGGLTATASDAQSYAQGIVGFGYFKGTATSAIVATDSTDAYGFATADVEWRDTFNVSAPGLAGTAGTATFAINVAIGSTVGESRFGNISPEYCTWNCEYAGTQWSLDVAAGAFTQIQPIKAGGEDTEVGSYGDSPGLFVYTVPIFFGSDSDIWVRFIGTAGANGSLAPGPGTVTASAVLDFANTVEWQGFSEVRDSGGNLVTAFSVSSGSGVDYSQPITAPVPLPAAGWLLATALASLGAQRRRFSAGRATSG